MRRSTKLLCRRRYDTWRAGAAGAVAAGEMGRASLHGLWVQQVINAVELSHHERRWVSLPLDAPGPAAPGAAVTEAPR